MEKRGNTEKIRYDFDTTKCCEIKIKTGLWCRSTPNEFRSWKGERRIVRWNKDEMIIEEYNGPVYYMGSNKIDKSDPKDGYAFLNNIDPHLQYSKQRATEHFTIK
jgi:hypothetical protein